MRDVPLASLSLDADDLWAYLRTHGDAAWEQHPSYLPRFYELAFELFESLHLRITFFIVGFDATREANRPALASLAAHGHEVGNHSFWPNCHSRKLNVAVQRPRSSVWLAWSSGSPAPQTACSRLNAAHSRAIGASSR